MKALPVTVLILVFLGNAGRAQEFRIGLTTGFNTNIVLDEGLKSDPRYEASYNYTWSPVGINATLGITKQWGLSVEAIFAKRETGYDIIDASESVAGEQVLNIKGVNIPIFLRYMSSGDGAARFNFNFGPQLSFLSSVQETFNSDAGIFNIPSGTSFEEIQDVFPSATQSPDQAADGTYELPEPISAELFQEQLDQYKKLQFQLAMAFGVDFDIGPHWLLSTQVRLNYSIDGLTNEDAFQAIADGDAGQIFADKATLGIGLQVGIHYSFNLTRAFARKQATELSD